MHDLALFSVVALREGADDLPKYLPDRILVNLLLIQFALPYQLSDGTTSTVLHDNEEFGLLLDDHSVHIPHDVLVLQSSQNVDFSD